MHARGRDWRGRCPCWHELKEELGLVQKVFRFNSISGSGAGMMCICSAAREVGMDTSDLPLHIYGPSGLAEYLRWLAFPATDIVRTSQLEPCHPRWQRCTEPASLFRVQSWAWVTGHEIPPNHLKLVVLGPYLGDYFWLMLCCGTLQDLLGSLRHIHRDANSGARVCDARCARGRAGPARGAGEALLPVQDAGPPRPTQSPGVQARCLWTLSTCWHEGQLERCRGPGWSPHACMHAAGYGLYRDPHCCCQSCFVHTCSATSGFGRCQESLGTGLGCLWVARHVDCAHVPSGKATQWKRPRQQWKLIKLCMWTGVLWRADRAADKTAPAAAAAEEGPRWARHPHRAAASGARWVHRRMQ